MIESPVNPELHSSNVIGEPNPDPQFKVVGPKEHTLAQPFIPQTPKPPKKQYGDPFWTNDVEVLWRDRRWIHFFPRENDTYEEKLNSVMRAGIYITLVLVIFSLDIKYLWILLASALLTIFLYSQHQENTKNKEHFEAPFTKLKKQPRQYVWPTQDNPMMNVQLTDYRDRPNRESISKIVESDDKSLNKSMDNAFYSKIFRDVSDVYSTVASERNFHTMPSTTIPNDQTAFAQFLYGKPPTCKEGNGFQCVKNEEREDHLRSGSRPVQL